MKEVVNKLRNVGRCGERREGSGKRKRMSDYEREEGRKKNKGLRRS